MNTIRPIRPLLFSLLLTLAAQTFATAQDDIFILPGSDLFTTIGDAGQTRIDYFIENPLPQDFFYPGSAPFDQGIPLRSLPFQFNPAFAPTDTTLEIGLADTLIERLETATLTGPGSSDTIPVVLRAMSLIGLDSLAIPGDGDTQEWTVEYQHGFTQPSPGEMTVTQDSEFGGTFTITIPANGDVFFGQVDGAEFRIMNLPFAISAVDVPWSFNAPEVPIARLEEEVNFGAFVSAVPPSTANFHPGVRDPGDGGNPRSRFIFLDNGTDVSQGLLSAFFDPQDDTDLDGIPDIFDVCPDNFDPFQEDSDNNFIGDACENLGEDPCRSGPNTLCLNGGRFAVELDWRDYEENEFTLDPADRSGAGTAMRLEDDTGLFWFFTEDNWEMLVKVLDGCDINSHFYVFAAATTNVEYTLTVTDTLSGEMKTYDNELGTPFEPILDTMAFLTCEADMEVPLGNKAPKGRTNCGVDDTTLCLLGARYEISLESRGTRAFARPISDGTGLFGLTGADNPEVIVNILDGAARNNHHWVYVSGLTDEPYTVSVLDTLTNTTRSYDNEEGGFLVSLDNTAFTLGTNTQEGEGEAETTGCPADETKSAHPRQAATNFSVYLAALGLLGLVRRRGPSRY